MGLTARSADLQVRNSHGSFHPAKNVRVGPYIRQWSVSATLPRLTLVHDYPRHVDNVLISNLIFIT